MPSIKSSKNNYIEVKGARVHNLKNVNLKIPRNKFIVITGLSGSGKSSLAFDTLYADGQRRYVESLSSYARQFLGRMNKPDVDSITGIPPAIAIEQKVNTRNPRSTVGTSTEIYDYIKLLFARIGKTFSPISNQEVRKHNVSDVTDFISKQKAATKALILSPIILPEGRDCNVHLEFLLKEGYSRLFIDNEIQNISDLLDKKSIHCKKSYLVIDRIKSDTTEESIARFADSVQTAFNESNGYCSIAIYRKSNNITLHEFSSRFEADGIEFEEPSEHMFSFNNPIGACPKCEGYGKVIGIDEDLVIPNKSLSVYEDAVVCWKGEKMSEWKNKLIYSADKFNFPIHKSIYDLSAKEYNLLWNGNRYFKGLNQFFQHLEEKSYKIQYRVMLSRYRGKTTCPECNGTRLKKETSYIKIQGKSIQDLVSQPISKLHQHFKTLVLDEHDEKIAGRLLTEIKNRVEFLVNVGLGYLSLDRLSSTLSGGESQRINLATSLGSSLVGSIYILDEPSIGLHPRDTNLLIKVLKNLRDIGNTVVVVEHEEEIIRAADEIIDIGPQAGRYGGEIVFQGNHEQLIQSNSLTAEYLTEKRVIPVPKQRRKWRNYIEIKGARENNLKNINVKIPLEAMTVITGVSGSGKSSLIRGILFPALNKIYNGYGDKTGKFDRLEGDLKRLKNIEFVDQNPIGKSSRSNPVTYIKAYDEIRKLMANQQLAKQNGFKPSHFSFNIDGGRCEECQGEGIIKVEMQFMADVELVCESCHGKRFKDDVLDVKYRGKNIHDILEMSIDEAMDFFEAGTKTTEKKIADKLRPLQDVGLGYVKLGQSSSTLSGGESQRVKLASFLSKESGKDPMLFVFDEPTTGLHFHDILKLLEAFHSLIERGHSILIIEHNQEIIKTADWIIDLGPEGGDKGGELIFEGTPEELVKNKNSYTAQYLNKRI